MSEETTTPTPVEPEEETRPTRAARKGRHAEEKSTATGKDAKSKPAAKTSDNTSEEVKDDGRRYSRTAWALFALVVLAVIVGAIMLGGVHDNPKYRTGQSEETTNAVDSDGKLVVLPVVGEESETAPVDTSGDQRTPPTFAPFTKSGQVVLTWSELVSAVNGADATWYIDAVNDRADKTGFGWEDVKKWANDPQLDGVSPLTIQVFGKGFSDGEAREIASELVGNDLAARLPIVRHGAGRLINSRSVGDEKVGDFLDRRRMVRVSLSPIVYKDGKVKGLSGVSGVFADCLNIWRLTAPVKSNPEKPAKPGKPDNPPPPTDKPDNPPPPPPPPPLEPKRPGDDPYPRGNAPVGGGRNEDPGPGEYVPPAEMEQPPETPRVDPPPPPPPPGPPAGSTPDPAPAPAPEPPVQTVPPADGEVTPPGGGSI